MPSQKLHRKSKRSRTKSKSYRGFKGGTLTFIADDDGDFVPASPLQAQAIEQFLALPGEASTQIDTRVRVDGDYTATFRSLRSSPITSNVQSEKFGRLVFGIRTSDRKFREFVRLNKGLLG